MNVRARHVDVNEALPVVLERALSSRDGPPLDPEDPEIERTVTREQAIPIPGVRLLPESEQGPEDFMRQSSYIRYNGSSCVYS
jgi:hypothetical protein